MPDGIYVVPVHFEIERSDDELNSFPSDEIAEKRMRLPKCSQKKQIHQGVGGREWRHLDCM